MTRPTSDDQTVVDVTGLGHIVTRWSPLHARCMTKRHVHAPRPKLNFSQTKEWNHAVFGNSLTWSRKVEVFAMVRILLTLEAQ